MMKHLSLHTRILGLLILLLLAQSTKHFAFAQNTTAAPIKNDILIFIRDDVYEDYQQFVNGRDVLAIKNFTGSNIRRDVVDMIIAQQALKLGGFNNHFSYAAGKVNFRNTRLLQTGRLLISFDSYWLKDAQAIKKDIYISDAVIRQGEYIAGIYTSPKNNAVLTIKTLADLKNFTAVSTPKWRTDWLTLAKLPLKKLIREDEWLSMARMVDMQWVDFMLMPFNSTPDQSFSMEKIMLIPVKNVAIMLNGSRHFVISKKHPKGALAYKAINIGLKKLRAQGAIVKAYQQAGFFVDLTKIKLLNE
jgi:hypothetical protein